MKKLLRTFLVLIVALVIFRGWLFGLLSEYKPLANRPAIPLSGKKILNDCDAWLSKNPIANAEQIGEFADNYACQNLSFTFEKCSTDPDELMAMPEGGRITNCVGYSGLFNAVAVYLVHKRGLTNNIAPVHRVGKIFLAGFDLHVLFSNPFFKDHDYNEIRDVTTGKVYRFDPSLNDCMGVGTVKVR